MYILCMIGYFWELCLAAHKAVWTSYELEWTLYGHTLFKYSQYHI
jgi:hypothetical protein